MSKDARAHTLALMEAMQRLDTDGATVLLDALHDDEALQDELVSFAAALLSMMGDHLKVDPLRVLAKMREANNG